MISTMLYERYHRSARFIALARLFAASAERRTSKGKRAEARWEKRDE
jgi:hypothetical protein